VTIKNMKTAEQVKEPVTDLKWFFWYKQVNNKKDLFRSFCLLIYYINLLLMY
jgi:hypothetical protein